MNAAVFDCFATKNTDFHRAHLALRATDAHACKKQSMTVFYFSPCGSTRSYAETAAQVLREAGHAVACMDLTEGGSKTARCGGALCFLCCPVYEAGAPALFLERLATLELRFESAALLVTYGGVAAGHPLDDLARFARAQGMRLAGAARVPERHCFLTRSFAFTEEKKRWTRAFACAAMENAAAGKNVKIGRGARHALAARFVGRFRARFFPPPGTDPAKCVRCGACEAACPSGALKAGGTDAARCIRCVGCVSVCPTGARVFRAHILARAGLRAAALVPGKPRMYV